MKKDEIHQQSNETSTVIPGLTRNPEIFHSIALLDAGSGPA
jgi:hypothetical protein